MCETYSSVRAAVLQDFRETFQETVEFDAGITFSPYVDIFDQNCYGVVIYSEGNDAIYVGTTFANIVWDYWDKNVDSFYWPRPSELVNELFDTYLPDSFDRTGAWTNSFAEEVYETAQSIVEKKFRSILNFEVERNHGTGDYVRVYKVGAFAKEGGRLNILVEATTPQGDKTNVGSIVIPLPETSEEREAFAEALSTMIKEA